MSGFDRLELSTETLRDLTQDELATAAGGNVQWTPACVKINEITEMLSLNCYSWNTEQCAR
jgi:hypothetical protein